MRKFIFGLTLFVAVILLSAAVFFTGITLADGRVLWTILIAIALCAAVPMWRAWRRLTGTDKFVWNYLVGAVVIASIVSSAFYSLNYFFSDHDGKHSVDAEVVSKYSREQAKRRTVGRRVIYTSDKTYTYHIVLRFQNGLEKEEPVPVSQYLKIRVGDMKTFYVEPGLFGIPVLKQQRRE